jgi:hypothetical protein
VTKIKILVFDEADHTLAEVDFILVVIFIFGEIRSIIITFKKLHYLILFVSRSLVCLGRQIYLFVTIWLILWLNCLCALLLHVKIICSLFVYHITKFEPWQLTIGPN